MKNPGIALFWICWRMSQRWLVTMTTIALALCAYSVITINKVAMGTDNMALAGTPVFILPFALACITSMTAISLGNKAGFPFYYQFRQPVSTRLLITVTMLSQCILCMCIFLVPVALFRLTYHVPVPIIAPGVFIATLTAFLLGSTWSTTTIATRTGCLIFSLVTMFIFLDQSSPFHMRTSRAYTDEKFDADIMAFSIPEYLILLLFFIALLSLTIYFVNKQRSGQSGNPAKGNSSRPVQATSGNTGRSAQITPSYFQEIFSDVFTMPCPTSAPWRAEVWVEMKRYGIPVLLFAFSLALANPVLFYLSAATTRPAAAQIAFATPLVIFFTGVGMSLFNRRMSTAGFMNPFEASRGMSTAQLFSIQLLVLAMSTLAGVVLVGVSIYLSLPLLDHITGLGLRWQKLLTLLFVQTPLLQFTNLLVFLITYLSFMAALSCFHSCSLFWRKKFMISVLAFVVYAIGYIANLLFGKVDLDKLKRNMWLFAFFILLITLIPLARTLWLRLHSLRAMITVLLVWSIFLLSVYTSLSGMGIHLNNMPGELLAFNLALVTLPLTFYLLVTWSFDKLRHG